MNPFKRAFQVIRSVGAAMLGVQSGAQAEQDFTSPSIIPYVIVGIVFVIIFVLSLITIIKLIV